MWLESAKLPKLRSAKTQPVWADLQENTSQ
jgi:hypothetical protein